MVRNTASSKNDDQHVIIEMLAAKEELQRKNEALQGDV